MKEIEKSMSTEQNLLQ